MVSCAAHRSDAYLQCLSVVVPDGMRSHAGYPPPPPPPPTPFLSISLSFPNSSPGPIYTPRGERRVPKTRPGLEPGQCHLDSGTLTTARSGKGNQVLAVCKRVSANPGTERSAKDAFYLSPPQRLKGFFSGGEDTLSNVSAQRSYITNV